VTFEKAGMPGIDRAEWWRYVPAHWRVARLKYFASKIGSGKTPLGGAAIYADSGVAFLRSQNVHFSGLRLDDMVYISREVDETMASTRVQPRDVLLNITGASLGRCALVPECMGPANVNQHVCIVRPDRSSLFAPYLNYLLSSQQLQDKIFAGEDGVSREGLTFDRVASFTLAIPATVQEQQEICAFLDRETARIDALIKKKERLITLLEEKRAALINRAVTKGLDPRAPMKDSGIPWLGSIPAHWHERKLGYLVRMVSGSTPDKGNSAYWQGETPWVSAKDMKTSTISDSEDHISDAAVRQCGMRVLPRGTVLVVVRGMILAHTFPVGLTTTPVTINQDMKALLPNPDCAPEFLAEVLRGTSRMVLALVEDSAHGTKCLRSDLWKGLWLFLPPLPEQHKICAWVGATASRFDGVLSKTRAQIAKFHEHRTALISAAVTGKIDVRGCTREEELLT